MSDPAPFNKRMREARGDLSLEKAARRAAEWYAGVSISKIRTLEKSGALEEDANPILVWALARAYESDLAELSPIAAEAMSVVVTLERGPDPSEPAGRERHAGNITDQQTDPSTCMDHLAVQSAA